jgi:DNA-binding NtrC family response regulator
MRPTNAPLNILVVDDAEGVRESLRATLVAAGHTVTAASGGEEALEKLAQETFDAIVTDLWMAGIDGVNLLKLARRDYPRLRLIAMTGGGPGVSIETASTLAQSWGAETVFLKPFDERQVIAFLEARDPEDNFR